MAMVTIIGAGMAGFGAAHKLYNNNLKSVIFERNQHYGGNCASFSYDGGYIFDLGPHLSFTKFERVKELFAKSVNQEFQDIKIKASNYWKGHWIKHPAQCNLHGLPENLLVDLLCDFINEQNKKCDRINNYADWLISSFGKTFAETFPMQYGLKFHTTTADNMSTEWLGPRMYRPKLEEVLHGVISPKTTDVHYINYVRYPTFNGYMSFLNLFIDQTELKLGFEVDTINPKEKRLCLTNGTVVSYDHVISSLPLPELIAKIIDAPKEVINAAQKLSCSSCVVVDIAIDRVDISDAHWIYFYDKDFFFTRLNFPHMLSPNNTPAGTGSIQAEVYYSKKYKPLDRSPNDCIKPVINDLKRCGLIREEDKILYSNAILMPYANVIFDLERADALKIVKGYLDDIGIYYCGRYGEWDYLWSDQSFVSGENAAQKIIESL